MDYSFGMRKEKYMSELIKSGDLKFASISEFKWSIHYGAEVGFTWNERNYHVCAKMRPSPDADPMICFYEDYKEGTEQWYATPDAVLDCLVDGVPLRRIITQMEVSERSI